MALLDIIRRISRYLKIKTMKYLQFIFAFILVGCTNTNPSNIMEDSSDQMVYSEDLLNFYLAFDSIQTTNSDKSKLKILKDIFLDNASNGQKSMIKARKYKATEYLNNIKQYPNFFESLRPTMMNVPNLSTELDSYITKFKVLYPEMKPAKIYFTVGAFRSNGTTLKDKVLIGSELALVDSITDLSEFSDDYWAREYWKSNPYNKLLKLNIHEYIHTQQNEDTSAPLYVAALREGVAEFISDLIFGIQKNDSTEPSIIYGRNNEEDIMIEFTKDMFNTDYGYWLWSNESNKFNTRDLAYFAGYVLAEKYYTDLSDKRLAIKNMIELDYRDEKIVEQFIDNIAYFPKKMNQYKL